MSSQEVHLNLSQDLENLSCIMRKPVFGLSDQARQKPAYTVSEKGHMLKILEFRRRGISCVAKKKALISCTVQLICACFPIGKKLVLMIHMSIKMKRKKILYSANVQEQRPYLVIGVFVFTTYWILLLDCTQISKRITKRC